MKEPDDEDLASHIGPESCECGSNVALEALTGVCAGWVLSPVMLKVQGADALPNDGRPHGSPRHRQGWTGPAGSKTPRTHGHTSQGGGNRPCRSHFGDGSREIPGSTSTAEVRIVNPQGVRR